MVDSVLDLVRSNDFHPLEQPGLTFTIDRGTGQHGIANLDDPDGQIRLLAVRDLVRLGDSGVPEIAAALMDPDLHVRAVSAAALGVLRANGAAGELERMALDDPQPIGRTYAAIALGEMVSTRSLPTLISLRDREEHRDVRHQCELAIGQIERGLGSSDAQIAAYRSVDESTFDSQRVGERAMEFVLDDTEGRSWRSAELRAESFDFVHPKRLRVEAESA